ncbi:MAG: biopolymer transporter ExbD [Gammaproteobacteria bacterium]|nr:biopolymer transporter ExbD [Gammaproteobacteria bacterium]
MAFNSSDNSEAMSEINVTPLVDVMLVLLVVFIVTAPLLTNAIKVNLPETAETTAPDDPDALTVSVDPAGKIYLDKRETALEVLENELRGQKARDPGLTLFLEADDAARYGTVAKVMAIIERAGIDKLAVITKAE